MKTVIALDPGTTTGIAVYWEKIDEWGQFEYGPEPHHIKLEALLIATRPDVLITESFIFQPSRRKIVLDSVEYIGVAKLYCGHAGKELVQQTASQGKAFWSDQKIKQIGLWLPNQGHAMDATRHLLFWWMRHGDQRFVEKLAGAE